MTKLKSSKREYNSSGRQAQARETRRRILEAAKKLFIERGYAGATAESIATETSVSIQTIYAIFKNKKRILVSLMNVSPATGTEEHIPLSEQPAVQAVSQEKDQRRQLQMFAQVVADNLGQVAEVFEIMEDAARTEPDLDRIIQKLNRQRLENMTFAIRQFAANGPFREGVDEDYARDIVWTLTSGEVFLLLTRDRDWSKEKYAEWLADTLTKVLLR